jgi:putative peptide zinc metalloprotease protein
LIVLRNIEETAKLRQSELDASRSRLRRDTFLAEGNAGAYRAECEHLAALEQRLTELRTHVETLTLRAPRNGVVIAENLAHLQGTWVQSGQLLLEVAPPQEREVLILAEPGDANAFREALAAQRPARFESAARTGAHPLGIDRVAPGATLHPGHFALMAPFQGPLAVRRTSEGEESGIGDHELVKPRIEVRASLRAGAIAFTDGERGRVTLPSGKRRVLADRIGKLLADWLDQAQASS